MRRSACALAGRAWVCAGLLGVLLLTGCTSESTRIALTAQRRADQVQQAVFDRQHEALRVLLYRDLQRRLGETGVVWTDERRAVLNEAWNERDLLEFWVVQHERAGALRVAGVDAKLAADRSPVELLAKSLDAGVERVRSAVRERAAEGLVESCAGER